MTTSPPCSIRPEGISAWSFIVDNIKSWFVRIAVSSEGVGVDMFLQRPGRDDARRFAAATPGFREESQG